MPVVQHIKSVAMQGDHFRSGQVGARPVHIDIAADGGDRGKFAQRIQDRRIADISGMEDVLDAAQSRDGLRSKQAMGIEITPINAFEYCPVDQLCAAVLAKPSIQFPVPLAKML